MVRICVLPLIFFALCAEYAFCDSITLPLEYADHALFATVEFPSGGKSPPQEMRLLVDTGSSELVVFTKDSTTNGCEGVSHWYIPPEGKALTIVEIGGLEVQYLDGTVLGDIVEGTFTLVSSEGRRLDLAEQRFGIVRQCIDWVNPESASAGILGLAPDSSLFSGPAFLSHIFSIYSNPTSATGGWELLVGASITEEMVNPPFDLVETLKLDDDVKDWIIEAQFLVKTQGGALLHPLDSFSRAFLDTGTAFTAGPMDQVEALYRAIDPQVASCANDQAGLISYCVSCPDGPWSLPIFAINFKMQGEDTSASKSFGSDFWEAVGQGRCRGAIDGISPQVPGIGPSLAATDADWIIGLDFMAHWTFAFEEAGAGDPALVHIASPLTNQQTITNSQA